MDQLEPHIKLEFPHPEENKFETGSGEQNKLDLQALHLFKKHKKLARSGEERKQKKPVEPGIRVGHWTLDEKKKYHWFLEIYHAHFENKQMRRMDKIFKTMADFLGSRAADQCRSHHQKMEKKYKTFYNIIYNLRVSHYGTADIRDLAMEIDGTGTPLPDSLITELELTMRLDNSEEIRGDAQSLPSPRPFDLQMKSPKLAHQPHYSMPIRNPMEEPLEFFNADVSSEPLI